MADTNKKTKTQLVNSQPWSIKYRSNFKIGSIIIIAVVFAFSAGYVLFSKEKKKQAGRLEAVNALAVDMPGWWYKDYFGGSVCDKEECKTEADPDGDGLNNGQEFFYHGNPKEADTNGNGKNDGQDVAAGIDPSKEGNVTFEELEGQDNIFGESLVFAEDIKAEFVQTLNPNNITVPLVEDTELKISDTNSDEAILDYVNDVNKIFSKYFTQDKADYIAQAVGSGDNERLSDIKLRAAQAVSDLKKVDVPKDFVLIQKYTISFFELLQIVIFMPDQTQLQNEMDPFANRWYDSAQAFLVLHQRLNQELNTLKLKYNITTW